MDMLKITGGKSLQGTVEIDGAKNSALPIMAASLAIPGPVLLERIPNLVDVDTMSSLLRSLNARVERLSQSALQIHSSESPLMTAEWDLMRRMRAGICVLGPLLARCGKAVVSLPGGCNIGHRPVDLHLKGMAALGADIRVDRGFIIADCEHLKGAIIDLAGPSGSTVTGTCNVMVAACLAEGSSVIRNAAREPEVEDLACFLNNCGARIQGHGTETIAIEGVEELHGQPYEIIPDRIEAATFAIAAAATRSSITLSGVCPEHLRAVIEALTAMGVRFRNESAKGTTRLSVDARGTLLPIDVTATPYPGIPTDTQAQLMALLATIEGESRVRDTVFPDRFLHASELMRMGATIERDQLGMLITGGRPLTAAHVMASDLRASAALVIAALAAEGSTFVHRIYHLDRGYAQLDRKLSDLKADVLRLKEEA